MSISPTFCEQLLHAQIPKGEKRLTTWLYFFEISGSVLIKAAHTMVSYDEIDTRCQFHQHFTSRYFVQMCFALLAKMLLIRFWGNEIVLSISPRFFKQLLHKKVYYEDVIFGKRESAQKVIVKCWLNCLLVSKCRLKSTTMVFLWQNQFH